MKRMLRNLALGLAALFMLVFGVAGWLLGSGAGARWVLDWMDRSPNLSIAAAAVDGSILGPLRLTSVTIQTPGADLELEHLQLRWRPNALFSGNVEIESLRLGKLRVSLKPPPDKPSESLQRYPVLPLNLLLSELTVTQVVVQPAAGEAQQIDGIQLQQGRWWGEQVQIESLKLSHAHAGTLSARLNAKLTPQTLSVERLVIAQSEFASQLTLKGQYPIAEAMDLEVGWTALRWPLNESPQLQSASGQLQLRGRPQDLSFELQAKLATDARIQASGRYAGKTLDADLTWNQLQWPLQGEPRIQSPAGQLRFAGQPEAYRYRLQTELMAEQGQGRLQASGEGDLQSTTIQALELQVADAAISGEANLSWQPALRADGRFDVSQFDPSIISAQWPGRINGEISAQSVLADGVAQTRFDLRITDSTLRKYPLRADVAGTLRGRQLLLDEAQVVSGDTRVQAQGRLTPPFDVAFKLDSSNLNSLHPQMRGRLKMQAAFTGDAGQFNLDANAQARRLQFAQWFVDELSLSADVDSAKASSLKLQANKLRGPLSIQTLEVEGRGVEDDHRWDVAAQSEDAELSLALQGGIDRTKKRWNGRLQSAQLRPVELDAWTLESPAELHAGVGAIDLKPACWQSNLGRACARFESGKQKAKAAFRLEELQLASLNPLLPEPWRIEGQLAGRGVVDLEQGAIRQARADLHSQQLRLLLDQEAVLVSEAGNIVVEDQQGVTTAALDFPLGSGLLRANARLGKHPQAALRPLSADATIDLQDLRFLQLLSAELSAVSGSIRGDLNWSGTLQQPRAQGALKLQDAAFALQTPDIEIKQFNAALISQTPGPMQLEARARSGEGTIELAGDIDLESARPSADLRIRGESFQAAGLPELKAWVSPDLRLKLADRHLDIEGELLVPKARIRPISIEGGIAPSSDQIIVQGAQTQVATASQTWAADVTLKLGEDVRFDGYGLKTDLTGSVRAIEKPGRPQRGRGELQLVDGRYKAYGQNLKIETGRLLFNGGPLSEPAVELRALRKPTEDVEVGVYVRGTLDEPEFSLFSTPAMPRERQLSWLVLGRPLDSAVAGDERAMLSNAALSLGLSGTDRIAQNISSGLGLDQLSIGAAPGEDAEQARLTVGKYLSPKIYVSYGVGLFQPGQVFKLLYDLGRGFKLATESGVHSGGDLLYSLER